MPTITQKLVELSTAVVYSRLPPSTVAAAKRAILDALGCQLTLHALSKGGLSMAKAIGYPWSAMSSVLATRLAREGFTGPVHFLDWYAEHSAEAGAVDPTALEHDGSYLIERVSFKQFPVQFELQTPVEIALRLHERVAAARSDIASGSRRGRRAKT